MRDFHPIRSYLRSLLLGAPLAALVGVAAVPAADLTPKTYVKAPPAPSPAYDWTGFYAGVNMGYGAASDPLHMSFRSGPGPGRQLFGSSIRLRFGEA
ncbi:hypothetical protein SAMN05444159_5470 [Bradyrhizobium lablabi]|jgi:outer membrane immunogenic protein|uniref:Outer membrane immunogenic protein n=1 Tax=Bradyrhizobium lablabi TaxID=722472 RepID=A0A1M6Z8D0_9BRAD|nr:hypothetical protein SAMN05444159_5470 [Bradyrhizobium lablabi]